MPFPSLTEVRTRLRERIDNAARGTDVPAGIDRHDISAPTSSRERGRMRRRLRELRRLREAQLLELGALVLEAHKHDRDESPVIKAKAAEAAATDAEARAIADALAADAGLDTIVAAGIAGPCPTCGTLASTTARFCATCGTALDGRPDAAARRDAGGAIGQAAVIEDAPVAHAEVADADAPVADADQPVADADAPVIDADAATGDADTTELHMANGNGASHEEVEAAREQ